MQINAYYLLGTLFLGESLRLIFICSCRRFVCHISNALGICNLNFQSDFEFYLAIKIPHNSTRGRNNQRHILGQQQMYEAFKLDKKIQGLHDTIFLMALWNNRSCAAVTNAYAVNLGKLVKITIIDKSKKFPQKSYQNTVHFKNKI